MNTTLILACAKSWLWHWKATLTKNNKSFWNWIPLFYVVLIISFAVSAYFKSSYFMIVPVLFVLGPSAWTAMLIALSILKYQSAIKRVMPVKQGDQLGILQVQRTAPDQIQITLKSTVWDLQAFHRKWEPLEASLGKTIKHIWPRPDNTIIINLKERE